MRSDAAHADQLAVTREVLREIDAADRALPWLLLNKIDRVDEAERAALAEKYPRRDPAVGESHRPMSPSCA